MIAPGTNHLNVNILSHYLRFALFHYSSSETDTPFHGFHNDEVADARKRKGRGKKSAPVVQGDASKPQACSSSNSGEAIK